MDLWGERAWQHFSVDLSREIESRFLYWFHGNEVGADVYMPSDKPSFTMISFGIVICAFWRSSASKISAPFCVCTFVLWRISIGSQSEKFQLSHL